MVLSAVSMAAEESQSESDSLVVGELKPGMKRKISLTICGVCGSEEARYRCPGCVKHSCSLACVRKHKQETGCSGVRDKTAFVALSHFDEMNLLNDYRFLEDTGRMADGANRDRLVRAPTMTNRVRQLSSQARRMNMILRFLPVTFTKSRENSTIFIKKQKRFLWHLKLLFPQSEAEFVEKRVPDERTLEQILTPYIHPTESEPVRRQKLKVYAVQSPFNHVRIFMKAEGRKANSVRYQELDLSRSLRDNLQYKTILEYPTLHIVLKERCQDYPLKGPAEATACCSGPAGAGNGREEEEEGGGEEEEGATGLRPSHRAGPSSVLEEGRTPQHRSPETGPPEEKRAKRAPRDEEELEDGELPDSDEECNAQDYTHTVNEGRGAQTEGISEEAGAVRATDEGPGQGEEEGPGQGEEEGPGQGGLQADPVALPSGPDLVSRSSSEVFSGECSGEKGDEEMTEVQGSVDDDSSQAVSTCEEQTTCE